MELSPIVILAGGAATRIRPLTDKIPKAMVEIAGKPFIAHQIDLLKDQGFSKIILCLWYKADIIKKFVGDGKRFGLEVLYSEDGNQPLGTAGAIRKAINMLPDSFFVQYGDSYLLLDYFDIQKRFEEADKLGLMTIMRNDGKWDKSNVALEDDEIIKYEKNTDDYSMNYIDYGLGLFRKSVFNSLELNKNIDLSIVYQDLIRRKQLAAVEVSQRFYEIGSFQGIQDLQNYFGKG